MNQPEDFWTLMLNECRKQSLPCVPVFGGEPWLSVHYLCANFLMIERVNDVIERCKAAQIPMLRINRKQLVLCSDIVKVFNCEPVNSAKGKVTK